MAFQIFPRCKAAAGEAPARAAIKFVDPTSSHQISVADSDLGDSIGLNDPLVPQTNIRQSLSPIQSLQPESPVDDSEDLKETRRSGSAESLLQQLGRMGWLHVL